ncbi:hypothetical protein KCP73_20155 [Salmonella enterica subsp. enterica]|nr:hypothetical protein KCP73_20155 [Salmonella enterica subsp. enterica]
MKETLIRLGLLILPASIFALRYTAAASATCLSPYARGLRQFHSPGEHCDADPYHDDGGGNQQSPLVRAVAV